MSHEPILVQPLEDIMGDRFGRYSKYIIQERALPDVRDGLKPVQRRILYAMYHERNFYDKPYRKSAKTVGIVIGNYHPHGDSSVYDAMVRLSQHWKMNMPLVDMQGNNGSVDNDPAAAMRYTEARLSKLAHQLLENIDEDVVPFVLNFDDMTTEPSVLPALYPNLLVNGSTGIAAGYATNMPPFNLEEVLKATIMRLQTPDSTVDDIAKIIKGPDFPTGAIIQGEEGISNIIKTGRGRVVVQAKTEIIEKKTMKQIVVTELPYEVVKSDVVRKIDDLRYSKSQDGYGDIMDVRDESDRNGLRIVVDCKRDADVVSILNLLLKNTDLQVYYNANMVAIVNQRPKVCSVVDIIDAFIDFRKEVVLNRTRFRYEKKNDRLHILEGLIKAISILDGVIATIRASSNRGESRDNIASKYGFTFEQASAIVDLQLYRLSSTDIVTLQKEQGELRAEVNYLKSVLDDHVVLHDLMIEEFNEVMKTFAAPRRSVIEAKISDLEVDHMNLIPNEEVMVSMSKLGYVKKVSMRSYGSSNQAQFAKLDEDMPLFIQAMQTIQHIIFFTDQGRYGVLLVHEIEEARWRDVGSHLAQYMKLNPKETIVAVYPFDSFDTEKYVISASSSGMIKKTAFSDFEVKRTNRLYAAMNLEKGALLVFVGIADENSEVALVSKEAQITRLALQDINPTGVKAKGVIGMKMKDKDELVSGGIIDSHGEIVLVSERGGGKRMKASDLPLYNRATQGQLVARQVKSNPHYISDMLVSTLQGTMRLYHEEIIEIAVTAVPLMDADASFSQLKVNSPFVIVKEYSLIEVVHAPKTKEDKKLEKVSLDI